MKLEIYVNKLKNKESLLYELKKISSICQHYHLQVRYYDRVI